MYVLTLLGPTKAYAYDIDTIVFTCDAYCQQGGYPSICGSGSAGYPNAATTVCEFLGEWDDCVSHCSFLGCAAQLGCFPDETCNTEVEEFLTSICGW